MVEVGDVDVVAISLDALAQPGVVLGGAAFFQIVEVPVDELEVGRFRRGNSNDDAARIDEMDFDIRRAGDFIEIEAGRRKAVERVQRAALQQFGERAFEGDLEARMGAEAGENSPGRAG